MKPIRIFVSALEYSANLHLKRLLLLLKERGVCFCLCGIFDDAVLEGYHSDFSPLEFRVMGFSAILKLFLKFFKTKRQLITLANSCEIALFMDSSSFNLPLIQALFKQTHKKPYLIYYILPQVWAWKAYRAKILSEACDALWGILPFEKDFYPSNANLHYVGHPLLDSIPYSFNQQQNTHKIAFMPGSRKAEIRSLFPIFQRLAALFKQRGKTPLLIVPHTFKQQDLNAIYGDVSDFVVVFDTYAGLKECSFAFVCSGTATLESTLLGIPTILAYKTRWLDYCIAKRLVRLNFIGLANLFLEFYTYQSPRNNPNPQVAPIHPEFLQHLVTPRHLLYAYENYDYAHFFSQKAKLLEYLQHGSAEICAKNLENLIKNLQK